MKVTIVGCGDAFGSGGRAHTCFRVDAGGKVIVVDFGASSIVSWKAMGFDIADIDAFVISHLHGDHFGGLPFVLLDCQYVAGRTKPLTIVGPPGLAERLDQLLEIFFPDSVGIDWTFDWSVEEVAPGRETSVEGLGLRTFEVDHPSGGPAMGLRLTQGTSVFAFSGDTAWTDVLFDIAAGADLFFIECFSGRKPVPYHMDWPRLAANLPSLTAKKIVLTHMNDCAFERQAEMVAAGAIVARDGQKFDL